MQYAPLDIRLYIKGTPADVKRFIKENRNYESTPAIELDFNKSVTKPEGAGESWENDNWSSSHGENYSKWKMLYDNGTVAAAKILFQVTSENPPTRYVFELSHKYPTIVFSLKSVLPVYYNPTDYEDVDYCWFDHATVLAGYELVDNEAASVYDRNCCGYWCVYCEECFCNSPEEHDYSVVPDDENMCDCDSCIEIFMNREKLF